MMCLRKNRQEQEKSKYLDLAPVDELENGQEYIEALEWAVNNERISNIALAGPYGAGKSSVIRAFLKNNPKCKALRVSMASFVENIADEQGKTIELKQQEIEEGILKQLFYKEDYTKIPQSRFRKIHRINRCRAFGTIFGLFVLGVISLFVFFPKLFDQILLHVSDAGTKIGISSTVAYILFCVLLLILLGVIAHLWRVWISRIKIKEVKVSSNAVINRADPSEESSALDKYLDEIVYFFEETTYTVVFFEDLDRLNENVVFVHLRELNTILNNCNSISKKHRITFVYAVKDDIFSGEDRTKFFDFIIPIIPVMNSTNSGDEMIKLLSLPGKAKHEISTEYIMDISPFITDMRILQNICNEFEVYKSTLRTSQDLNLRDEAIMSLIIFKNLYPKDFSDLQNEKGVIKRAFEDKEKFIRRKKREIQEENEKSTEHIAKAAKERLKSKKEIKAAMLMEFLEWGDVPNSLTFNQAKRCSVQEIMSDDFDYSILNQPKSITAINRHNYTITLGSDKLNICTLYYERLQLISEQENNQIELIRQEIEQRNRALKVLSGMPIRILIEQYGIQDMFSDEVKANPFLVYALRKGYIDEKYVSNINYFKGHSITTDDMNFILNVKNCDHNEFSYPITKRAEVVRRLQVHEFGQKEALNFDLLNYLLGEKDKNSKLSVMMEQLADGSEISWKFIDEFVDNTDYIDLFIKKLATNWNAMWGTISQNPLLSDQRKTWYLCLLCKNLTNEELILQNGEKRYISNYFESKDDILFCLKDIDIEKMKNIICSLGIHFRSMSVDGVSIELLNAIFDNEWFEPSEKMIEVIVKVKDESCIEGLAIRNYSTISALDYRPLLTVVRSEIEKYCESIVLRTQNTEEFENYILDLLIRIKNNSILCERVIEHENYCVDTIDSYIAVFPNKGELKTIVDMLLNHRKLYASWENVIKYYGKFGFSEELVRFITQSIEKLKKQEYNFEKAFSKGLLLSDVDDEIIRCLFEKLDTIELKELVDNLDDDRLLLLTRSGYFELNNDNLRVLTKKSIELAVALLFAGKEDLLKSIDELKIDLSVVERVVISPDFEDTIKCAVLEKHAISQSTELIADYLSKHPIAIGKGTFENAWDILPVKGKQALLFNHLTVGNAQDYERWFSELAAPYSDLSDVSRRHDVLLENNADNYNLANRLQQIGYISSYNERERSGKGKRVLVLKVRARK